VEEGATDASMGLYGQLKINESVSKTIRKENGCGEDENEESEA
jgi:hypothetical protein